MITELPSHPYGSWSSTITATSVAEGALRFGRVQIAGGAVYWSEGRPLENGRTTIMRWRRDEGMLDLLPPPFSARSRVHEYGGGEFLLSGEMLFFVNDSDQNIYETKLHSGLAETPRPLTAQAATRFADFVHDQSRKRLIAVAEEHDSDSKQHGLPKNSLWSVSLDAKEPHESGTVLLDGFDFYANPRLNPDGAKLCFLAWDLPNMPWDAASLYVADVATDGSVSTPVRIAGGNGSACFQPEWHSDGTLYFVWDADGFGNLFRWTEGKPPTQVTYLQADVSKPLWNMSAASYSFLSRDCVYLSFVANGKQGCAIYDLNSLKLIPLPTNLTAIQTLAGSGESVAFVALTDDEPLSVSIQNSKTAMEWENAASSFIIQKSSNEMFDRAYISEARRLEFSNPRGDTVFGMFYSPANPQVRGPNYSRPPLIISLHGGPTGASSRGLKPRTLFFTSRGFAWLDLDYSGSTGYGRAYRDRLRGRWGIQDVEDTVAAANFVSSAGLVDDGAIFVTGGSAGGFTALMAIATSKIFRGAASYYGICDLVALQRTTHKFERGYQSGLLGATLEENETLYRNRSALTHIERINTPLILFQGSEDQVVPKEQSRMIADALLEKHLIVEYHEFEGEGHGFRKAETIRNSLQFELDFYQRLL